MQWQGKAHMRHRAWAVEAFAVNAMARHTCGTGYGPLRLLLARNGWCPMENSKYLHHTHQVAHHSQQLPHVHGTHTWSLTPRHEKKTWGSKVVRLLVNVAVRAVLSADYGGVVRLLGDDDSVRVRPVARGCERPCSHALCGSHLFSVNGPDRMHCVEAIYSV